MKLLVLTSEYPNPHSAYDTPVVHYYVREWMARGHEVRVVHSRSVFPAPFYLVARLLTSLVKRVFRTDFIPVQRLREPVRYRMDGVDVLSLPIFKLFPHVRFLDRTVRRHAERIRAENERHGFRPDFLVCHFLNPQLPLIPELKRLYPAVRASLVIHEDPRIIPGLFGRSAAGLLDAVDAIGFRYRDMQERFVRAMGERPGLFLCPSGVPERYVLAEPPSRRDADGVTRYCFAGMLIPLKNVDVLLKALAQAHPSRDFRLRIVGQGLLEGELRALVSSLGLGDCVSFEGHRSRDEVQQVLEATDVFVMVSKPEAFGLVYLEAMAKGCITVGTRGQGIDGVIVNGENGYLCEAGNVEDLRDTLQTIQAMSEEERAVMATRALRTAAALSDPIVADEYLRKIGVG